MLSEIFNIKNKVVMIVGASSGIGASLAEMYAKEGARVIVCARRKDKIETLVKRLKEEYNIEGKAIPMDISDENSVVAAVEEAIKEFKEIDVLINNAGTTEKSEDITTHSTEQWDRVLDVNLKGYYLVSREVVKHMKERQYGKIINVSSVCGLMGLSNQVSYAASKSGVIGLTRSMATELGRYNITVNAIAPGIILTEMINPQGGGCRYFTGRTVLGRSGEVEDLHGTVLLLSTDASRYITGSVITVDGGITANI